MMQVADVVIIGLGGIGIRLYREVGLMLNSRFPHARLVLVDFDSYEPPNRDRQLYPALGLKAMVCSEELERLFPALTVAPCVGKVDDVSIYQYVNEGDIVLLAPDNYYCRRVVSERAAELGNITVISGGNSEWEGSVQVYVRRGGQDLTRPLHDELHPEIRDAQPEQQPQPGCAALAPTEPQRAVTNNLVAAFMLAALENILAQRPVCDILYLSVLEMNAVPRFRTPLDNNPE